MHRSEPLSALGTAILGRHSDASERHFHRLVFIDVDGFKEVNDTAGHRAERSDFIVADLLARADAAMYAAKRTGKNRVAA